MGKNIAAGVVGIIVAFALVWLIQMVGHTVYPPPADLDMNDMEAMGAYVATLPVGALLFVIASYFLAALGGTCAACAIGTARPLNFALVVGGLMFIATAFNLVMIPHPMWFSIVALVVVCVGAWFGMKCKRATAGNAE